MYCMLMLVSDSFFLSPFNNIVSANVVYDIIELTLVAFISLKFITETPINTSE